MRDPRDVLREAFGHAGFRGLQEDVVRAVVAGEDAVVLFPTGAGKSVCYQVPALCLEGTALVVSPLLALMRDQVEALRQAGVNCGAVNSSTSSDEYVRIMRDFASGALKLLYVSPERLVSENFVPALRSAGGKVSMVAIDEAHCVSQWGHDFREDYLQLAKARDVFPGVPIMALTATADPQTANDLKRRLGLADARTFVTSFDRPNIRYSIDLKDEPRKQMLDFLALHKGEAGIVYCLSKKKVDETAEFLRSKGYKALPYHAGLSREERDANQDAFLKEPGVTVVATVAFGMGIDKPDVRYVYHTDLPGSVEAWYQETGRAGRDGLPSEVAMSYGMADVVQRRRMIDQGGADDAIKRIERAKLDALVGICETSDCRRQAVLAHFGERHGGGCGNCDSCLNPVATYDGTERAQKILSAMHRTGQFFGAGHVIDVVRGKATPKVKAKGHDRIKTFGVGKDVDEQAWRSVVRQLTSSGIVRVDMEGFNSLKLTDDAYAVMRGERPVMLKEDRERKQTAAQRSRNAERVIPPEHAETFEALRAERSRIAKTQNVPPYVVFNDASLLDMAERMPASMEEMKSVSGMGDRKLEKYGAEFLAVLSSRSPAEATGP